MIVVSIAVLRTILSSQRNVIRRSERARRSMRILRQIDYILCNAELDEGRISFKDYGLVLCEVDTLRKLAHGLLPERVESDLTQDLLAFTDRSGTYAYQVLALKRIRWAYAEWWAPKTS
jgi:nuclear control of ATPase protein 2